MHSEKRLTLVFEYCDQVRQSLIAFYTHSIKKQHHLESAYLCTVPIKSELLRHSHEARVSSLKTKLLSSQMVVSVVFYWLRNKRSRKCFSHTWLGVWVHVSMGSSGHMVFQSSVVFAVICHCLTCLDHLPFMFFLGFKVHVVPQLWLFMYLQLYIVVSVSCQPFISSFCTVNLLICGVDIRCQAAWLAWHDSHLCLEVHLLLSNVNIPISIWPIASVQEQIANQS